MGLGNGNPKSGDRGSNHNYEHRSLLSLGAIAAFVGGGATEATLQLVLAAVNQGSEFEARLVEDAANVTWLEVRTWNTTTGTWNPVVFYPPNSNTPGLPTLPVTYINNSSVLATIASNTTGLNLEATQLLIKGVLDAIKLDTANLDVALSTRATEATLAALEAKLNSLGQKTSAASAPVVLSTEQQAILNSISSALYSSALGSPKISDIVATEAQQAIMNAALVTIDSVLDSILLDTTSIDAALTATVRTPSLTRAVVAGSVAAGARSVSVYNAGTTTGVWLGAAINPGEQLSYDAGAQGDTLGAFAYTASATAELVITTIV